ncbi:Plant disease resistance response protein [Cinnamomum micranthum f. kanehirae]|uniref:Dirigent protein n=1 Tax=Cinnamomum micranthum f. kanehirae TaxID=337451 RepID=A0A3S3P7Z1_9MAGN|nr:Plant disease resistance response protein [Cinnamomum micranthum f. kanehirae]
MACHTPMNFTPKSTTCLLLLAIAITCATSARILDEGAKVPGPSVPPESSNPVVTPVTGVTAAAQPVAGGATGTSAIVANDEGHQHPLSFFMHDVLGGSSPSARVVTGIVASSGVNGQIPFSKNNANLFPINGGIPLVNGNNGMINNNNIPFLTGLGGGSMSSTASIVQNGGNNINGGGNNLPFVTAGQLPAGATLQKLLFGSTTVIDDELTEGHELGSGVLGKAQGFYLASSQDGTSQTMALTAIFEGEHIADTLSFFGVHRTVSPESQIAIVGGTGKYANAKGYATVETIHQVVDQHTTDGVDTLLHFTVYLS